MKLAKLTLIVSAILMSSGCGNEVTTSKSQTSEPVIRFNQLGFAPQASKFATIEGSDLNLFQVLNQSGELVFKGQLTQAALWKPSEQMVQQADFSQLTESGVYRIQIPGKASSEPFEIKAHPYSAVHDAALKAYYFNRASTELKAEHAGQFARPMGHPDTQVKIHSSAATPERPEGYLISAPKGWYDAGDYNKYVVNSGISTYTLLAAYALYPEFYQSREWNIPESGDGIPDLVNEILWNLEWLEAMQDPNDGGVYNKLTTQYFSGAQMPHEANEPRYVVAKGTAAALNFSAVMASAARILAPLSDHFPGLSQRYQKAAIAAWEWALAHPNLPFVNPEGVYTGGYGDDKFDDEFSWAAAELFLLTQQSQYLEAFKANLLTLEAPSWGQVGALGYISLSQHGKGVVANDTLKEVNTRLLAAAQQVLQAHQASAYGVSMEANDFVWGSNAVAMNRAIIALEGYRLTEEKEYLNAAQSLVDYVLGKNPTGYSFVTGFGHKTPQDIHHRPSYADQIAEPIPGWLAGGPHSGQQDNCEGYPSKLPAKSYLDDWCSYASNEITINWNAPLVYSLAVLENSY